MYISIIMGILVALGWGMGDIASKKVVDNMGVYAPILALQIIFSVLVCGGGFLLGIPFTLDQVSLLYLIAGSVFSNIAWLFFYKALDIGYVSVLSALYTLYVLIPFSWQILFQGLHLSFIQILGAVCLLVASIIVSLDLSELKRKAGEVLAKGLKEILLAVVFVGFSFIFINEAVHSVGWKTSYFYQQLFSLIEVPALLLLFGKLKESKFPSQWKWIALVVGCNLVAFLSLNYGMEHGYLGVVSVAGSFSTSVTALLAWFLMKEKLVINQYLGIGLGIIGLIGLSLA